MRTYVLLGLRKAAEHVAEWYNNDNKIAYAYLAGAVTNLLKAENYMDCKYKDKIMDIAESIAGMMDYPDKQFIKLVQAYREELNRREE